MKTNPLVSIIVLSYENFVYLPETLDSILKQDYENIELIISDDCSSDFQPELVQERVDAANSGNIKQLIINQNPLNLGTVQHYNAAIQRSSGDIIKLIAADDVLYDESVISSYVKTILTHDLLMVTSQYEIYDETLTKSLGYGISDMEIKLMQHSTGAELFPFMANAQLKFSLGVCLTRTWFEKFGSFDEGYRIDDDWPTWLRAVRLGCQIHYMDKVTLKYRSGGISSTQNPHSREHTIQYVEDIRRVWAQEIIPRKQLVGQKLWRQMMTEHTRRDEWPVLMAHPPINIRPMVPHAQ